MRIRPRNWKSFQHYTDRKPSWVKLHRGLLDDYEFHCLPVASRALAPLLWLVASEHEHGEIDANYEKLAFRFRMKASEMEGAVKPLIAAGFFELAQDASNALAELKPNACLERETETEREREKETERDRRRVAAPKAPNGSRIPDDFGLTPERKAVAEAEKLDATRTFADFRDYWTAVTGAKARKADWDATWRVWCRRQFANGGKPSRPQYESHEERIKREFLESA